MIMLVIKINNSKFFEPQNLRHSIVVGWSSNWGFLANILLKKVFPQMIFSLQDGDEDFIEGDDHCQYHLIWVVLTITIMT